MAHDAFHDLQAIEGSLEIDRRPVIVGAKSVCSKARPAIWAAAPGERNVAWPFTCKAFVRQATALKARMGCDW
jgi:hypothetical protein